jgi:hypothetical protein
MIGVTIATSKHDRLWPTEHWKPLIDSLCRGGAKTDPRTCYPALSFCLSTFVCEANGRFYPTSASQLASGDDTATSFIRVIRVRAGGDSLTFHPPEVPDISGWPLFEFPYLGTIGSSKSESQSKQNRRTLASCEGELFQQPQATGLWLHFQLSATRRDRDLDNLADGLMSFFNKGLPQLAEIRLSKAAPHDGLSERLWVSIFHAPDHGLREVASGGLAAEVASADAVITQGPVDGAADLIGDRGFADVVEHQAGGEE